MEADSIAVWLAARAPGPWRARQKKLAVAANSVYKPGAPDGCLTTCAQHRDLWSSAAAGDQTYGDDLRRRRRSAMIAAARGDGAPPAHPPSPPFT